MSESELNEVREIQKEILELIGQAQTEEAILLARTFLEKKDERLNSSLVLISNRFFEIKRRVTLGLSVGENELNDVNYALINFASTLASELSKEKNNRRNLSKKGLSIVMIIGVGIITIWWISKGRNKAVNHAPSASLQSTTMSSSIVVDDSKAEAVKKTDTDISPIQFNVNKGGNTLKLVFYSESIRRNDTFEIDTRWYVADLKQAIIEHYKIKALRTLLLCEKKPLYGDGGEYVSINFLVEKGALKEFDELSILKGEIAKVKFNIPDNENKWISSLGNETRVDYDKLRNIKYVIGGDGYHFYTESSYHFYDDAIFTATTATYKWPQIDNKDKSSKLSQKPPSSNKNGEEQEKYIVITSKYGLKGEGEIKIIDDGAL